LRSLLLVVVGWCLLVRGLWVVGLLLLNGHGMPLYLDGICLGPRDPRCLRQGINGSIFEARHGEFEKVSS
jgi:hypothetical protein